ncbi:MAG: single-stranded-DNA-specific exonuclease RecJ [Alphaproteobacteria bacterium]|nr:single-stranded-DNA-specific exonuclease RecJ [Alphaproteobacteria bacterium]
MEAEPFLGVARSLRGRAWRERPGDARAAAAIAEREGLPDIAARVLANRGVTPEAAPAFLRPQLRTTLPDPSCLKDMDMAAERLADAAEAGETVAVFADYDVDGATSAALLARFLEAAGGKASVHVPDRITEGYGPNEAAFDRFAAEGRRLVLLVDCGTTAFGPLAHAAGLGLECVVLDHHLPEARLPEALAVVNPNRLDETGELGGLAAVGVVFLLVVAANRALRRRGHYRFRPEPDLREWLDLVALGTVADVMELTGLNRTFVARGLEVLARRGNPGIAALLAAAGVERQPGAYHLGFVLGPRINAGGRVGEAGLGARLLASGDAEEACRLAEMLERLNGERRQVEADVLAAALAMEPEEGAPFVLAVGEGWHPGVVGIVASRLVERYRRPALVGALEGARIRGSARSVPGVPIGPAILAARDEGLLEAGGGHDMAAGFTLDLGKRGAFEAFLAERLGPLAPAEERVAPLDIDAGLSVAGASAGLLGHLAAVEPFGRGNPEPVFALPAVRVRHARIVGKNHVRADLADAGGGRLAAIAFRSAETPLGRALLETEGGALHVAGTLRADDWRGNGAVQLVISDAAPADTAP